MATRVKLYNEDCLVAMQLIPPESIDLILCDPPYGLTKCKEDKRLDLGIMWERILRIVKKNTPIVLTAQTPFDKILGYSRLDLLKYEWIWEKTSATGHFNAKKRPLKAHENILVFYQSPPTYHPQITHGHPRKTAYKRQSLSSYCYNSNTSSTYYDSTDRYPRSVIRFKSDKQTSSLHPLQKPVALMEYFIKTYSNPGDTVLDFTMGSGTTGVAAVNLGRNFIGIENNANYFSIAMDRIYKISKRFHT